MDIAKNAQHGDITLKNDGLRVFLEQLANDMLSEATIDFHDEYGFVISGTQQTSCCG